MSEVTPPEEITEVSLSPEKQAEIAGFRRASGIARDRAGNKLSAVYAVCDFLTQGDFETAKKLAGQAIAGVDQFNEILNDMRAVTHLVEDPADPTGLGINLAESIKPVKIISADRLPS